MSVQDQWSKIVGVSCQICMVFCLVRYHLTVVCDWLCPCLFRVTADLCSCSVRWGKVWMRGTKQRGNCIFISCQPRCQWYVHSIIVIIIVIIVCIIVYLLWMNHHRCNIISIHKVIKMYLRIKILKSAVSMEKCTLSLYFNVWIVTIWYIH